MESSPARPIAYLISKDTQIIMILFVTLNFIRRILFWYASLRSNHILHEIGIQLYQTYRNRLNVQKIGT